RALEPLRRQDPATDDGRRHTVAAVAMTDVDGSSGDRPEPRQMIRSDVDGAAPRVLDPHVCERREEATEPCGRSAHIAQIVGEGRADPATEAGPTAAATERDPAV